MWHDEGEGQKTHTCSVLEKWEKKWTHWNIAGSKCKIEYHFEETNSLYSISEQCKQLVHFNIADHNHCKLRILSTVCAHGALTLTKHIL